MKAIKPRVQLTVFLLLRTRVNLVHPVDSFKRYGRDYNSKVGVLKPKNGLFSLAETCSEQYTTGQSGSELTLKISAV